MYYIYICILALQTIFSFYFTFSFSDESCTQKNTQRKWIGYKNSWQQYNSKQLILIRHQDLQFFRLNMFPSLLMDIRVDGEIYVGKILRSQRFVEVHLCSVHLFAGTKIATFTAERMLTFYKLKSLIFFR